MLDSMEVQLKELGLFMSVLMVLGVKFVEEKMIPTLPLSFVLNLDIHPTVGIPVIILLLAFVSNLNTYCRCSFCPGSVE